MQNLREPITIIMNGAGTFESPYYLSKDDVLYKHLLNAWGKENCPIFHQNKRFYQDTIEDFVRSLN